MLHPDDPFYGDVYNDYDLFGKTITSTWMKNRYGPLPCIQHESDPGIAPIRKDLDLGHRMERAVYLGLDEKNITAKYIAGKTIIL